MMNLGKHTNKTIFLEGSNYHAKVSPIEANYQEQVLVSNNQEKSKNWKHLSKLFECKREWTRDNRIFSRGIEELTLPLIDIGAPTKG